MSSDPATTDKDQMTERLTVLAKITNKHNEGIGKEKSFIPQHKELERFPCCITGMKRKMEAAYTAKEPLQL